MILTMIAETYLHPGIGQSTGAVDLPVMRESTTKHPCIFGSSLKGSLLEAFRERKVPDYLTLFGAQTAAGTLLIGDARLLLLPVRSLTGIYKWVTCPLILERLCRDMGRGVKDTAKVTLPKVEPGKVLGVANTIKLTLEERQFNGVGPVSQELVTLIERFIPEDSAKTRLLGQLVILNDNDFAWFAENGLPIQAHNQLAENTKQSENLWFEENLPPDTVMYSIIGERAQDQGASKSPTAQVATEFQRNPYLRVGGDETTGKGWMRIGVLP
jgi:CRISPR-associated protein Cmr4